jgi:hypothetical protein
MLLFLRSFFLILLKKSMLRKSFYLLLFCCVVINVQAQTSTNDSLPFNPLKADIHQRHWNVYTQLGIHKRSFAAIGISKSKFLGSPHGIYGYDAYAAGVFFPKWKNSYENVYGYKIGANFHGNMFHFGADVQVLNTATKNDVLFTPRFGFGISSLYVSYGYSYSKNKFNITGLARNSVSMSLNLPIYTKDLLKEKIKK